MVIHMEKRRTKQPLHLSEKMKLLSLWKKGLVCSDIAAKTGRSSTTVCRWINRWLQEGHVNTRPRSGRPRTRTGVSSLAHPHQMDRLNLNKLVMTPGMWNYHLRYSIPFYRLLPRSTYVWPYSDVYSQDLYRI